MRLLQNLLFLFLICLITLPAIGQNAPLQKLEARLMRGDTQALFELAPYFDSHKIVEEHLGYHILQVEEASIARRLVDENCLFTDREIKLSPATSAQQFLSFLQANRSQLVFSPLAAAFLVTPLEQRTAKVQFRAISATRKKELETHAQALFGQAWARRSRTDSLVARKDAAALRVIASESYKVRQRFNSGPISKEPFMELLQLLTGTEIGVEDEKQETSWHPDQDFYPTSQLNLLIYFATAYRQYIWSEKEAMFLHPAEQVANSGKERELFESLNSRFPATAMQAYVQLSTSDPAAVQALCDEYSKADLPVNRALPTFPYRFLSQLAALTDYCRANHLDYHGSSALQQDIEALKSTLPFAKRYQLENKLINSLSLSESTALEYWTLINEESYRLPFSSGRVLDVLYSRHWSELLASPAQLDCYLKKAVLFDRLGINGACNNYRLKFSGASPATMARLKSHQTQDPDIRQQIAQILSSAASSPKPSKGPIKWEGNQDVEVAGLEEQLAALVPQGKASAKQQAELVTLLSKISYRQIGVALAFLESVPFADAQAKYSFMNSDWGFFLLGDVQEKSEREQFKKLYAQLSEYDLYRHYLNEAGIDYQDANNRLDYDKLYELIKFDNGQALVGGGGATDNREVYALIKLLELTFKTTLGFPNKFCNSAHMFHCSLIERTHAWMGYLEQNKLLKHPHVEPVSFSLE